MAPDQPNSATWPPIRVHGMPGATPVHTPVRTPRTSLHKRTDSVGSNGSPLPPTHHRKQMRNGYEQTPKIPSYQPFALNNPGTPRQRAFDISSPDALAPLASLDPSEWNTLALETGAIPPGAELHSFQVRIANLVLMRLGDAVVISCTGSGKSLSWTLPLLARKEGISLVVTPYTSLGLDGAVSYVE